jgi:hypothetical protein
MKGYKAFCDNWTCWGGFQYEIGNTYQMENDNIQLCQRGFHFCQIPIEILLYYIGNCKYAEVYASGKILEDKDKCVCSQIKIIKELTLKEIKQLTTGVFIKNNGTKLHYLNGQLHRLDGPAIEKANGTKKWCSNGFLTREDGPAIEKADGTKEWYLNGQLHRSDGPAVEKANGTKKWCLNGQLHRLDGPAIEKANGTKEWYQKGELHSIEYHYLK